MRSILGVNCFSHDTAACLLVDGSLVAFSEQERFNRERHTKAFPHDAIEACLEAAGIDMRDVDVVTFAHRADRDFARGARDALTRRAPKRLAVQAVVDANLTRKELEFRRRWRYRGRIARVEHHLAHAASAFFASPFDDAAVLTMDRGGDFLSTTLSSGAGNRLRRLAYVRNPDSLGEVYSALTWFLGFHVNADEGKVMGLAPYGRDRFVARLRDLVHLDDGGRFHVNMEWFAYDRERGWFSERFYDEFGAPRVPESEITSRDEDLAFGVQAVIEEAALHVARRLRALVNSPNLCLSGGLVLNSVMNTRLLREAGFEHVFIQPAASDAGNALGAALCVWHQRLGHARDWTMRHASWGPEFGENECVAALETAGLCARRADNPAACAAALLAAGKVVGWFQGRAEVGPRALGHRSILADPRRPEMKDVVNARVKRREGFRPFAPSVLDERGPEYFDGYTPNEYMLLVEPVRPTMRETIPAVTHVDGTARLQSVDRDADPLFRTLLEEFDRLTGVPVVLNTSFNLRGEPIVLRPQEAVDDFLRSEMDALVLGPYVVDKRESSSP
jgi:carbamoyltransferase